MNYLITVILSLFVGFCHGFLPNHLNGLSAKTANDYTHEDITEIGILKVVARIFEANPPPGKTIGPGSLQSLTPMNAQHLFDQYYGANQVSAKKLQSAIDDIVKANNRVDLEEGDTAAYHFNGEQIKEGNQILLGLRRSILEIMKKDSNQVDYDAARELIGKYLHVLQMFYSNTNWIEIAGTKPYRDLGIPQKPLMAVAPLTLDTCKSCETGAYEGERDPCTNNLLVTGNILTSGYKSGQDVSKPSRQGPDGKCSHGGPQDQDRYWPATGGINKETSDPNTSPHYHLHFNASRAAIQHTALFFDDAEFGLLKTVGIEKLKELLNIAGTGSSLIIVMDISGSMSNDVVAAKKQSIEVVRLTKGRVNAPYNYILSTFSDPETIGGAKATRDADEFIRWLQAITVDGGGDCPEYCMLGVLNALKLCLANSKAYIFTDASAKDPERVPAVMALATNKKVKLNFLLTGKCSRRRKRDTEMVRVKRSTGDLFKMLAQTSGGSVINTDKANIKNAVKEIKTDTEMGSSFLLKKLATKVGSPTQWRIPVDNTVNKLSVKVTGERGKPNVVLLTPDGSPVVFDGTKFILDLNIDILKLMTVVKPQTGVWLLNVSGDQEYGVTVEASSVFGFSFTLNERVGSVTLPVDGNPIVGTNLTLVIDTIGLDKVATVDTLLFTDMNGNEVLQAPLKEGKGRAKHLFRAEITIPTQDVRVGIRGLDNANNSFIRAIATPITPETVKLEVSDTSSHELVPGGSVTWAYNVHNYVGNRTFEVKVSKDKNYDVHVDPSTLTLTEGEIGRGDIVITVDRTVPPFTSTVTISVTHSTGTGTSPVSNQYVIKRLQVSRSSIPEPRTTKKTVTSLVITDGTSPTASPSKGRTEQTREKTTEPGLPTEKKQPASTAISPTPKIKLPINTQEPTVLPGSSDWDFETWHIATLVAAGVVLGLALLFGVLYHRSVVKTRRVGRMSRYPSTVSTGKLI